MPQIDFSSYTYQLVFLATVFWLILTLCQVTLGKVLRIINWRSYNIYKFSFLWTILCEFRVKFFLISLMKSAKVFRRLSRHFKFLVNLLFRWYVVRVEDEPFDIFEDFEDTLISIEVHNPFYVGAANGEQYEPYKEPIYSKEQILRDMFESEYTGGMIRAIRAVGQRMREERRKRGLKEIPDPVEEEDVDPADVMYEEAVQQVEKELLVEYLDKVDKEEVEIPGAVDSIKLMKELTELDGSKVTRAWKKCFSFKTKSKYTLVEHEEASNVMQRVLTRLQCWMYDYYTYWNEDFTDLNAPWLDFSLISRYDFSAMLYELHNRIIALEKEVQVAPVNDVSEKILVHYKKTYEDSWKLIKAWHAFIAIHYKFKYIDEPHMAERLLIERQEDWSLIRAGDFSRCLNMLISIRSGFYDGKKV